MPHRNIRDILGGSEEGGLSCIVAASAVVASLGGVIFGYDIGIISSASLQVSKVFNLTFTEKEIFVSSLLMGAFVGSLLAGFVVDYFGRRRSILGTIPLFILGSVLLALSQNLTMLLIGRLLVGFGIALSTAAEFTYISEISPPRWRGMLVSLNEFGITVGFLLSYLAGHFCVSLPQGWRIMFALSSVPAVVQLLGITLLPPSPYYLVLKGQLLEAEDVLLRTLPGCNPLDKLYEIKSLIADEKVGNDYIEFLKRKRSKNVRFQDLFSRKDNMRQRMFLGISLNVLQQLSGNTNVLYYSPVIFQQFGYCSDSAATMASIGLGAVKVLTALVALPLVDRVGRRPLLWSGVSLMALSLFTLSAITIFTGLSPEVKGRLEPRAEHALGKTFGGKVGSENITDVVSNATDEGVGTDINEMVKEIGNGMNFETALRTGGIGSDSLVKLGGINEEVVSGTNEIGDGNVEADVGMEEKVMEVVEDTGRSERRSLEDDSSGKQAVDVGTDAGSARIEGEWELEPALNSFPLQIEMVEANPGESDGLGPTGTEAGCTGEMSTAEQSGCARVYPDKRIIILVNTDTNETGLNDQTEKTAVNVAENRTESMRNRNSTRVGNNTVILIGNGKDISEGNGTDLSGGDCTDISAGDSTDISAGDSTDISAGDSTDISAGDSTDISAGDSTDISAGDSTDISAGDSIDISSENCTDIDAGNGLGDGNGTSINYEVINCTKSGLETGNVTELTPAAVTQEGLQDGINSSGMMLCTSKDGSWMKFVSIIALMIYICAYQFGFGIVTWMIVSEIFPTKVRGRGVAVSTSANWFINIILASTFLNSIESMGLGYTFLMYACFCCLSSVFIGLWLPETNRKSLSEISKDLNRGLRCRMCRTEGDYDQLPVSDLNGAGLY